MLAIRKSDGEMLFNPPAEAEIQAGDFLIVMGEAANLRKLEKLLADGFLKPEERIVIYNTGAGLKYLEAYATRFPRTASGEQDKLGGLITPR